MTASWLPDIPTQFDIRTAGLRPRERQDQQLLQEEKGVKNESEKDNEDSRPLKVEEEDEYDMRSESLGEEEDGSEYQPSEDDEDND
jgi:hypothetical protein